MVGEVSGEDFECNLLEGPQILHKSSRIVQIGTECLEIVSETEWCRVLWNFLLPGTEVSHRDISRLVLMTSPRVSRPSLRKVSHIFTNYMKHVLQLSFSSLETFKTHKTRRCETLETRFIIFLLRLEQNADAISHLANDLRRPQIAFYHFALCILWVGAQLTLMIITDQTQIVVMSALIVAKCASLRKLISLYHFGFRFAQVFSSFAFQRKFASHILSF